MEEFFVNFFVLVEELAEEQGCEMLSGYYYRHRDIPQSVAAFVLNEVYSRQVGFDVTIALPATLGSYGMASMKAGAYLLPACRDENFPVTPDYADRNAGCCQETFHEHLQAIDIDQFRQCQGHEGPHWKMNNAADARMKEWIFRQLTKWIWTTII